jgi:hypothetical protein
VADLLLEVTVPFSGQNWNLRAATSLLGFWTSNIGSRSPLVQIWICLPFPLILSSLFVALIRVYLQFLCGIFLDGITVLNLDKVFTSRFLYGVFMVAFQSSFLTVKDLILFEVDP